MSPCPFQRTCQPRPACLALQSFLIQSTCGSEFTGTIFPALLTMAPCTTWISGPQLAVPVTALSGCCTSRSLGYGTFRSLSLAAPQFLFDPDHFWEVKCYNCGQHGHYKSHCPQAASSGGGGAAVAAAAALVVPRTEAGMPQQAHNLWVTWCQIVFL